MVEDELKPNVSSEEIQDQDLEVQNEEADLSDESEKPVAEPTVRELQQQVVELGMPKEDAEKIKTKQPLLAILDLLKANKVDKEVKRVASLEEKVDPVEERQIERIYQTKAEKMRAILESQPKVRFFLPIEPTEKPGVVRQEVIRGRREFVHVSGAIEVVQLNGYKTLVPKGVFVEIPQQVAEVLAESMQLTQQAGSQFLIDRVDPQTGRQVSEQL